MATLSNGSNVLDFEICQNKNCESFNISETTGLYSSSNTGGWAVVGGAGASVNFAIADVIDARLVVTLPDDTEVTVNDVLYPTLPDSTGDTSVTITNTHLNLTGSLPDGIYVIKYQVDVSNVSSQTVQFQTTKTILLSCTIKCCVDRMIAKIATDDCTCEDKSLKNALLAFTLLQSLYHSGASGNTTNVTNLLDRLEKLCDINDCGCQ